MQMMDIFSALICLISIVCVSGEIAIHELCKPTVEWTADGRDVLIESRGRILFVAFMELNCPYCHLQLNQFKIMSEMLSDVRFVVIAPRNESDYYVKKWQADLNSDDFIVFRETNREPVWRQLNVRNHDFFLFDRCGRLAYLISHPQSNTSYHHTLNALHAAVDFAQCGWCQYDPNPRRPSSRPDERTAGSGPEVVVAAVQPPVRIPSHGTNGPYAPRLFPGPTSPPSRYHSGIDSRRTDGGSRGDDRRPPYVSDNRVGGRNYPPGSYDQRYTITQPPPPIRNTYQQPSAPNRYDSRSGYDPRVGATAPTAPARWQQPHPDQSSYGGDPTRYHVHTGDPSHRQPTAPTPQPTKMAEIYDDDYKADYEYESDLKPTASVQEQIPPTQAPQQPWQTPKPFMVDNIPCTAYTDAVCYEQQQRNGVGNIHQCCHKLIYLSSACVPNNCGNETYQLCCFQKFIQARYRCCNSELITGERPDEFSHCCFADFVERDDDDPCCPGEIASQYWSEKSTLFELCLPNIDADFSKIKLTAKMKDQSTVTLNLGENKLWDYQCPNAIKRDDYFFYLPDTNATATTTMKP